VVSKIEELGGADLKFSTMSGGTRGYDNGLLRQKLCKSQMLVSIPAFRRGMKLDEELVREKGTKT